MPLNRRLALVCVVLAILALPIAASGQAAGMSCPAVLAGEELQFEKAWLDEESSVSGQEADGRYVVESFRKLLCVYDNELSESSTLNTVDVLWFSTDHADYSFACYTGYDDGGEPPSDYLASPTHVVEAVIYVAPPMAAEARALAERLVAAAEPMAPLCGSAPADGSASNPPSEVVSVGQEPDTTSDPENGPSEEALLIAAGLILLLVSGAVGVIKRPKSSTQREGLGDEMARNVGKGFLRMNPSWVLWRMGVTKSPPDAGPWNDPLGRPDDVPAPAPPEPRPIPPVAVLEQHFADTVAYRATQGYTVRNRTLVSKGWNIARDPFWNDPSSGHCQEYAEWGEEWTRGFVRDTFGADAVVDTIVVEEQSTLSPGFVNGVDGLYRANHAATRVILPDGRRLVLDFWDAISQGQGEAPRIQSETEWGEKWKAEIGEGVIDRPEDELTLRNFIGSYGQPRGLAQFRRTMAKDGKSRLAEVLIKSWEMQPW